MYRHSLTAIIFVVIAACATNEPQTTTPVSKVEKPATNENNSDEKGDIQVAEVPDVPKAPGSAAVMPDQQEIICHREKRTGSHRLTRVCRTRAEIEKTEAEAKDSFKEMLEIQRNQTEY